ncbi:hypothetical protein P3T76_010620 [Phytophthora citrophthora]|uniref:Uncharacterized protein n=1 Tax=Phytophthora citrophthora TaxID=4793 RepID=A0AAD9GBP2_9STRA|nr:hypothetical protein P3T76_010620 [Phytophthora citrophthora]
MIDRQSGQMAAVAPTPADTASAQRPTRLIPQIYKALAQWVRDFSGRLPGEYTISKLDAFDQFQHQVTTWQIIVILLSTPVPCVIVNIVVENIPLSDPATGLHGSIPFLLRNFLTASIVTSVPFFIKPDCIAQLPIQSWKLSLGFGLLLGIISTGTIALLIVLTGVFPVPMSQFAPMIPMGVMGRLIEMRLLRSPEIKPRLEKIDQWLAMVVAPIVVYPIFTAFFMALKPSQQMWISLLLPVIKLFVRYLLWLVARNDLDVVGTVTCTIGHFYHALFTAMCLQNAKSLEMLAAVVAVNSVHMLLNCRGILQDAREIRTTEERISKSSTTTPREIVFTTLVIAQTDQISKYLHRKKPSRFFSEYPKYQDAAFVKKHHALLTLPSSSRSSEQRKRSRYLGTNGVSPDTVPMFAQLLSEPDIMKRSSPAISSNTGRIRSSRACNSLGSSARSDADFVVCVTSTLHQTEIILLRSYITICAVILRSELVLTLDTAGIYLTAVYWLPNRQYFATMRFMTSFDAVMNSASYLFVLCGIEILFLAMYLMLIQRLIGISGLSQLAFVLQSQRVLIQGKFIMLSIMILGFPLEHYGNGSIFRVHTG